MELFLQISTIFSLASMSDILQVWGLDLKNYRWRNCLRLMEWTQTNKWVFRKLVAWSDNYRSRRLDDLKSFKLKSGHCV